MAAIVQLLQSLVWVALIAWAVYYFREDIRTLLRELQRRIELGQQLEFGPLKLQKIEEKVTTVEDEIDVSRQFLFSMNPRMYENLKKLASGKFGEYIKGPGSGLERELYHLRNIGYINVNSIRKIPHEDDDLSKHIDITPAGRKFVDLREAYVARRAREKFLT